MIKDIPTKIDEDAWVCENINGEYTIIETLIKFDESYGDPLCVRIWNNLVPSKVSILCWTMAQNRLLTRYNLIERRILGDIG